jgi:hypothetical protein
MSNRRTPWRRRDWALFLVCSLFLASAGCQSLRLPWSSSGLPTQWEPELPSETK